MALQAQFGRYHIIERLGKGGMATVYKAYDPSFKREVALKLLPDELQDDPTLRARFEREAQAIAGLELPAIVPVFDLGEQNGQLYLVMQVMTGGSLADRLRGGALPSDESADIIGRLAPALDEAHQRGLIHRDIKPANILFDQSRLAYLSDFGIVKRSADTNELTGDFIIGTPTYMAPEMATQSGQITPAADIYMLGAVLYEMLTGSPPYSGDHAMQVLLQHINAPIPDPRHIRPDLPGRVSGVIRQALAKQPGDRYPTAQALADDLQAALAAAPGKETQPSGLHRRAIVPEDALTTDGPVVVPERPIDVGPPVAQPEPGRKRSRIPGWLFIVGILAVVLVGLVIVFSSAVGTLIEQSNLTQQAQKQLRETAYFEQTADALFSSAQQTIQAQTAEARAVQAIADANATAQAEATGTALEQAAATQQMQATQNAAAERLAGARRGEVIFEPQTKDLPHNPTDSLASSSFSNLEVDNFFAEVTFIVPYNTGVGAWDFGFAFRFIEDEGRQYWLVIQSDGDWFLRLFFNNEPTLVQEGQLNNLNLEAGSENVLALIADGDRGIFFVNDVYITDLDLGALLIPGNLAVGVGFINDHEVEGYATTYRDFTVRALP